MYLSHMTITCENCFPHVEDYSQFFLRRVPEGVEPLQPYTTFLLCSKDRADPEPGPVGSLPVVCFNDGGCLPYPNMPDSPGQSGAAVCLPRPVVHHEQSLLFPILRLCDVAALCKGVGPEASLAQVLFSL